MKAVEFPATVNPDGTFRVPEGLADKIPRGRPLRVFVLIPECEDESDWEQLAATDFGQGHADSDAIYDELSGR
jgi:hypothetical protein